MKPYDHKRIEKKWQKKWLADKCFSASDSSRAKKYYALIEFPFPSGDGLHTGHIRSYTGMDIVARKRRAEGYNVLYPIGWDAFGLPTENYAIKVGKDPRVVTKKNTDTFRRQLQSLGISFDWQREINTTDPTYYKWTQWIFLQLYKKGLAYKGEAVINWCPKDKIGLANEEVVNGACERCGTLVEKRTKSQWMLAITKYAERLYNDLDTVDYLEKIKIQQRNWIGRSEGAEINFQIVFEGGQKPGLIPIFTTRPDTIFGATYMVFSPEHLWVTLALDKNHVGILKNADEVRAYVQKAKKKTEIERTKDEKEKTGVELKGVKAINPATGEKIPIFVADYVLAHYGTGAVMAVPAHDERDWHFAKKYKLPIKEVVEPTYVQTTEPGKIKENEPFKHKEAIIAIVKHWSEEKFIALKWKQVAWGTFVTGGIEEGDTPAQTALKEIREETGFLHPKFIKELGVVHGKFYHVPKKMNTIAHAHIVYLELENGEQELIADEEKAIHEILWLSKNELKKFLTPETHHYSLDLFSGKTGAYTGDGYLTNSGQFNRLEVEEAKEKIIKFVGGKKVVKYKLRDWVFSRQRYWGEPIPMIHCPKCGTVPVPEKDLPVTLPKVKKYEPTDTGESPLAEIVSWVKVKCPQCKGLAQRETDVMPNWAGSSWYFLRYVDPKNKKALADKKKLKHWMAVDWYNGGMEHTTLHLLYSRFWNKFLFDIGAVPTSEPYKKRTSHGLILAGDGEKMSKSKGNVVNPDGIISAYGADSLRLYEMFMGPFSEAIAWNTDNLVGLRRFIERVWRLSEKVKKVKIKNEDVDRALAKTIEKVSADIESLSFNTAVSALMVFSNELEKKEQISQNVFESFLVLFAPFAPHVAEELWHTLGHKGSIFMEKWPLSNKKDLLENSRTIAIQINGKVRTTIQLSLSLSEEAAKKEILANKRIKEWVGDKEILRFIYVPGKIANIVISIPIDKNA